MSRVAATYSPRAVWLHWLTAGLLLLLWLWGRNIDWFAAGPARINARSGHMATGLIVLALVVERIFRRFTHPVVHAPGAPPLVNRAAMAAHWVLLALVLTVILIGLGAAWVRGDVIFNLFKIPAFDPANRALRRTWVDVHGFMANVLLVAAGLHGAAAVAHAATFKDGALGRMIPVLRRP